jgi:hypothetical protein
MVGRIIQRTYFRYWVKGVWNDMNEPAVMEVPNKTFPMDVRHDYDGNPCSHRKAHNIYGTQMARATYHGVKRFAYPKDLCYYAISLCRSATLPPHGQEIILHMGTFMDSQYPNATYVNFRDGFYGF